MTMRTVSKTFSGRNDRKEDTRVYLLIHFDRILWSTLRSILSQYLSLAVSPSNRRKSFDQPLPPLYIEANNDTEEE